MTYDEKLQLFAILNPWMIFLNHLEEGHIELELLKTKMDLDIVEIHGSMASAAFCLFKICGATIEGNEKEGFNIVPPSKPSKRKVKGKKK